MRENINWSGGRWTEHKDSDNGHELVWLHGAEPNGCTVSCRLSLVRYPGEQKWKLLNDRDYETIIAEFDELDVGKIAYLIHLRNHGD